MRKSMPEADEESSQIFILIVDETYDGDQETWEEIANATVRTLNAISNVSLPKRTLGPALTFLRF
jgi:hypothetical protein